MRGLRGINEEVVMSVHDIVEDEHLIENEAGSASKDNFYQVLTFKSPTNDTGTATNTKKSK